MSTSKKDSFTISSGNLSGVEFTMELDPQDNEITLEAQAESQKFKALLKSIKIALATHPHVTAQVVGSEQLPMGRIAAKEGHEEHLGAVYDRLSTQLQQKFGAQLVTQKAAKPKTTGELTDDDLMDILRDEPEGTATGSQENVPLPDAAAPPQGDHAAKVKPEKPPIKPSDEAAGDLYWRMTHPGQDIKNRKR